MRSQSKADDDPLRTLRAEIEEHCIVRRSNLQSIKSSNGQDFAWMFDLRPLLLDGRMLQIVADRFWEQMERFWPFQIAGPELAAVPIIAAVAVEGERRGFRINGMIIRNKRKKYGRMRLVEGAPDHALPVVLDRRLYQYRTHHP